MYIFVKCMHTWRNPLEWNNFKNGVLFLNGMEQTLILLKRPLSSNSEVADSNPVNGKIYKPIIVTFVGTITWRGLVEKR